MGDAPMAAGFDGEPVAATEGDDALEESEGDLVIATIPGVQRFVAESRRTADLFASSELISELSSALVGTVTKPAELVLPASTDIGGGIPNRIVVFAPHGRGEALAERMAQAVRDRWESLLAGAAPSHGFPVVQWVVAPSGDGYEDQWRRAQRLLMQRKRIRDFVFPSQSQSHMCSLTGRWPATLPAEDVRAHPGEFLSSVALVKRRWGRRTTFPSTLSIASALYRAGLIESGDPRVAELCGEIETALGMLADLLEGPLSDGGGDLPGMPEAEALTWLRKTEGAWVMPQTWDVGRLRREYGRTDDPEGLAYACEAGGSAVKELRDLGKKLGVPRLSPYLAVLAQDADRLGEKLGNAEFARGTMRNWHGQVSRALAEAGRRQRMAVESRECLGKVVYAGGDDLLALLPLATAVKAARKSFTAFQTAVAKVLPGASISTAIVFFHVSSPLQSVVATAQNLLEEAKKRNRPGVAISVLHRGGERATWIAPWEENTVESLSTLAAAMSDEGSLSARLAMELERDRAELETLDSEWLEMELFRRAARHGISEPGARALAALSRDRGYTDALLVARFLAAEGTW